MNEFSDVAPVLYTPGTPVDGDDPDVRPDGAGTMGQDASGIVDAVLEGGPVTLPAELRIHRVAITDQKVKVRHNGGYEHFERDTSLIPDAMPVVFRWTGRTRIAE